MLLANTESGPVYKSIGVPEIDENPLLAHLRLPPEDDKEAFRALGLRPKFDPNERNLPTSIRRLRVNRLRRFFVPTLPSHRRALIGIISQLFDGYLARNPMTPEGQAVLYGGPVSVAYRPTITFVTGYSGMGKSTLLDRILAYAGIQVQRHTAFRGVKFPETQILWLRRNVPEHCTVGTLCSTFGDYTDRVLRMKLYAGIFNKLKGGDRNLYLAEVRKIITNHHVGALVLDEFQNLSLMGVGAAKIIALLVNLRDELGIPIVVVGTHKSLRFLEGNMATARRLCEGGHFDLERPTSHEADTWQELCPIAWMYQWVRNPIDYSAEIGEALYEVSQGITGIMLTAFATAQVAAMDSGTESVDADLIRKVFREQMTPLHPAVRILQSGDPRMIIKFDDLYRNGHPTLNRGDDGADDGGEPEENKQVDDSPTTAIEGREDVKSEKKPARRTSPNSAQKPVLSDDQIKKLVLADSMADLLAVLDHT